MASICLTDRSINMKLLKLFTVLIMILVLSLPCFAIRNANSIQAAGEFKIVGYLDGYHISIGDLNKIDINRLTHIIYDAVTVTSSTNPALKTWGDYSLSQIDTLVTAAHNANIKAMVTILGAWSLTDLKNVITNSDLRAQLIANIRSLCISYDLDGIDIDCEQELSPQIYSIFITELHSALDPLEIDLSIAGSWVNPDILVTASQYLDFINVMCYDMYSPNPYPYHALYKDSIAVMQKWADAGFIKSKLLMGIPFYARDDYKLWIPYDQIVDQLNPADSENSTSISTFMGKKVNGGVLWWGSIELDSQKVNWIKTNGFGGVMVYSLGTDKLQSDKSKILHIYNDFYPGSQDHIVPASPVPSATLTQSNPSPIPRPIPGSESVNPPVSLRKLFWILGGLSLIGLAAFFVTLAILNRKINKK
jgi:GH18 family chitinase